MQLQVAMKGHFFLKFGFINQSLENNKDHFIFFRSFVIDGFNLV